MRMRFWCGLFALSCFVMGVESMAAPMTMQFVRRSGAPVTNARVVYREFDAYRQLSTEMYAQTTPTGHVTLHHVTKFAPFITFSTQPMARDYLLVSIPNEPIRILSTTEAPPGTRFVLATVEPFRLAGNVVDGEGQPVSGAEVTLVGLGFNPEQGDGGIPLNIPSEGVVSPEFTVYTDQLGGFAMPPIFVSPNYCPVGAAYLRISYRKDGVWYAGAGFYRLQAKVYSPPVTRIDLPYPPNQPLPPPPDVYQGVYLPTPQPITISCVPAHAISGRVVHAITGDPLPGVTITLASEPWLSSNNAVAPVLSNMQGAFTIPVVFQDNNPLLLVAHHRRYAMAWAKVGEQSTLSLSPIITITGQVIDEDTKAPPAIPVQLKATYGAQYQGFRYQFGGGASQMDILPGDEAFALSVPVGDVTLQVMNFAYRIETCQGYTEIVKPIAHTTGIDISIDPNDIGTMTLLLRKKPTFVVQFLTDNPAGLAHCELRVRTKDEEYMTSFDQSSGYWISPAKAGWGDTVEIYLRRREANTGEITEVLPWTSIIADPNPQQWPRVLTVK